MIKGEMINEEISALIPGTFGTEFQPVSIYRYSKRLLLYSRSVYGYQGTGRRVWTAKSRERDWLVISIELVRYHSPKFVAGLITRSVPKPTILHQLAQYNLRAFAAADGSFHAGWQNNGLNYKVLMRAQGPFLVEAIAAAQAEIPDVAINAPVQATADAVAPVTPPYQPGWGGAIAWIWGLVYCAPVVLAIALIRKPLWPLLPDALVEFLPLAIFVGYLVWLLVWQRRVARKASLQQWSEICERGDRDGTFARALDVAREAVTPNQ